MPVHALRRRPLILRVTSSVPWQIPSHSSCIVFKLSRNSFSWALLVSVTHVPKSMWISCIQLCQMIIHYKYTGMPSIPWGPGEELGLCHSPVFVFRILKLVVPFRQTRSLDGRNPIKKVWHYFEIPGELLSERERNRFLYFIKLYCFYWSQNSRIASRNAGFLL